MVVGTVQPVNNVLYCTPDTKHWTICFFSSTTYSKDSSFCEVPCEKSSTRKLDLCNIKPSDVDSPINQLSFYFFILIRFISQRLQLQVLIMSSNVQPASVHREAQGVTPTNYASPLNAAPASHLPAPDVAPETIHRLHSILRK